MQDPDPDPDVCGTDPRIRIRTKMSRIRNTVNSIFFENTKRAVKKDHFSFQHIFLNHWVSVTFIGRFSSSTLEQTSVAVCIQTFSPIVDSYQSGSMHFEPAVRISILNAVAAI